MRRLALLIVLIVCTVYALWIALKPHALSVSFFDVGQGDSIFIESPSGVQVLIDGGRDRSAVRALGMHMPFFDRTIDAVIATHPDKDHIGGLIDVFDRYQVQTFIEPGIESSSDVSRLLQKSVFEEAGLHSFVARRGIRLDLGAGVYLDILYPDRDVSHAVSNDGAVVSRLVFGNTEYLFMSDVPMSVEKYLLHTKIKVASDVLKVGHHGSKTSSSREFLQVALPRYAIFSRGCDNTYGHPHRDVVNVFAELNIETHDTCKEGTITFSSDGERVSLREAWLDF